MWLQQLLNPGQQPGSGSRVAAAAGGGLGSGLFHGLRVRMGVATGVVMRGEDVKNSSLYKRAQGEDSCCCCCCHFRIMLQHKHMLM